MFTNMLQKDPRVLPQKNLKVQVLTIWGIAVAAIVFLTLGYFVMDLAVNGVYYILLDSYATEMADDGVTLGMAIWEWLIPIAIVGIIIGAVVDSQRRRGAQPV